MLIGLVAKNAILVVEFAKLIYVRGTPLLEAALEKRDELGQSVNLDNWAIGLPKPPGFALLPRNGHE